MNFLVKKNVKMKMPVIVLVMLTMCGSTYAQETSELSDRQYCELEAEEAGMSKADDVRAFVDQCLEEIRQQDQEDMGSGHDEMSHDSSSVE